MNALALLQEIQARVDLAAGTATFLLVMPRRDAELEEARRLLAQVLGVGRRLADLGACTPDDGPAAWVERTHAGSGDVLLLSFVPRNPLEARTFARGLNAQREILRELPAPTVLVVPPAMEASLRESAPDFFTWIAQTYVLPDPTDLATAARALGVSDDEARPPEAAENPVRFLHISDLHLKPDRVKRYDQDRVLKGLLAFLEKDRADFPLDLVFVTGDLAQSGRPDEYVLVTELLQALSRITGVPLERVFVVPGNHDVDRAPGKWLLRSLGSSADADAFFLDPQSRRFHAEKFAAYSASMHKLFGARPLGLGVGAGAVETVEVRGARIAVASLSSAWFAQGDDDNGKLWLGESNVTGAIDKVADDDADFAIALMHHPFEQLHEADRTAVEDWMDRGFDLVLRGHLHANRSRSIATQRGGYVEVAAPAAYQGSQWSNGCFLGEIRAKARTVRLRPYRYTARPDPWVLDAGVFPDDEKQGYTRVFVVPEKQRAKSEGARLRREAAERLVATATPAERRDLAEELGMGSVHTVETLRRYLAGELGIKVSELLLDAAVATELVGDLTRVAEPPSPASLQVALTHAGRVLRHICRKLAVPIVSVPERAMLRAIHEILSTTTGWLVADEALLRVGFRADILIRTLPGAAIEVKRVLGRRTDPIEASGLSQLDSALAAGGVAYGALILLGALPADATEPALFRRTTPAGHEVVVMHL